MTNTILSLPKKTQNISFLPSVTMFFFILTFTIKALTDQLYINNQIPSAVAYLKYLTAAICCFTAFLEMHNKGEHIFINEFNALAFICVLFTSESFILLAIHGSVEISVLIELIRLIMPIVLAYAILNSLTKRQVNICITWILVVSVFGYVLNLIRNGVTFLTLFRMNFGTSESTTEDSGFAMISLMLALYFLYYRENIIGSITSVIFCILTFKRLAIVICLIALIISLFFPKLLDKKIGQHVRTVFKILTLIITALWYWLLLPQQEPFFIKLFGKSPGVFTSGRSSVMNYLLDSGFKSYGFGSASAFSYQVLHVSFEMDLIKIAFELTPIALIIFVWLFWDIAGISFWSYFIVGYLMLNMITSDSLSSNFSFTLAYVTIGLVNASKEVGQTSRPIISTLGERNQLFSNNL